MKGLFVLAVVCLLCVYSNAQIADLPFGTNYATVEIALRNKWGKPFAPLTNDTQILYTDVRYGGFSFDFVLFGFQNDTNGRSYFNRCQFSKNFATEEEAEEQVELYAKVFGRKYENQLHIWNKFGWHYSGGVSPVDENDFLYTIFVIDYDVDCYGACIGYGPFQFTDEEW